MSEQRGGDGRTDFPVVGIGSSAGGLEALERFFGAMPPDSGMAFVVVAHLDPTRESHLAEILGRCTAMPVVQVRDPIAVEPDHVYVIAPGQDLTLSRGVLHPARPAEPRAERPPIDLFLRSLAEDRRERAIGVMLSGTGGSGAAGLAAIKGAGGVTLAQDPGTAGFGGMPQSAIAAGIVDLVLPPEKMAKALLDLGRHPYLRRPEAAAEADGAEQQLGALLALLRARTRQDFRCYKRTTLLRRIHRRMGLRRVEDLDRYVEAVRDDPAEAIALARDLTINVTGFFRDPEAWRALDERVVAPLVAERPADAAVRVWAPGCATGEEAYSVAMLIAERAEAARKPFDVKIFATDVVEDVLATARAGLYPAGVAEDVAPERLRRFFDRDGGGYRIKKALRDMVLFAPQNLLQDPPFSRLDLITCRNLLIYLEPEAQRRTIALFHFALREGGHLFLGSAETATGQEDLFQPVSKKWRIYRRVGATRRDAVEFPVAGAGEIPRGEGGDPQPAAAEPQQPGPLPPRRVSEIVQRALLERYAPASVLIDRLFRVHYFHGPTEDYLRQPGGEPTHNLLALARDGLHGRLRAAVQAALDGDREVTVDARVRRGGGGGPLHPVRITVAPLRPKQDRHRGGAGMLLVSFHEREAAVAAAGGAATPADAGDGVAGEDHAAVQRELEEELNAVREELRISVEQMETTNEELRTSNEEFMSTNEELQSANEELETSKEELQSLNEELNTVNSQLQAKVEELEGRTNDLNNLLNSTDVATLFLDAHLRIRWFTPAMRALLDLLPTDVGRPVQHFAQRFDGGDLVEDGKRVLRTLQPADAEVAGDDGRWYIRHVTPYRTDDNRIDGVVVTFVDITERKRWEQQIAGAKEFAEKIVDTVPLPLVVLSPDLRVRSANKAFYRDFKVEPAKTTGRLVYELGNGQWDIPDLRRLLEEILPENNAFDDYEVEHEFDALGRRIMRLNARRLDDVQLILLAIEDVTERRRAEAAVRANEERLRKVVETDAVGVVFFDEGGTVVDANDRFLRMTGYSRRDVEGRELTWRRMTPPEWIEASEDQLNKLAATGRLGPYEKEYFCKDGSRSWMLFAGSSLGAGTFVEYCVDINDRKRVEQQRELLTAELNHRVKNTLATVQSLVVQTLRHTDSVESFRQAFEGRLLALARGHDLLVEGGWRGAELGELLVRILAPYRTEGRDQIAVDCPAVTLRPQAALALTLILHELATNAAKYGALSVPEGRLRVSCTRRRVDGGDEELALSWVETGGPRIAEPPAEKGFGTSLIERSAAYELHGAAALDYREEGLRCEVAFPLAGAAKPG